MKTGALCSRSGVHVSHHQRAWSGGSSRAWSFPPRRFVCQAACFLYIYVHAYILEFWHLLFDPNKTLYPALNCCVFWSRPRVQPALQALTPGPHGPGIRCRSDSDCGGGAFSERNPSFFRMQSTIGVQCIQAQTIERVRQEPQDPKKYFDSTRIWHLQRELKINLR